MFWQVDGQGAAERVVAGDQAKPQRLLLLVLQEAHAVDGQVARVQRQARHAVCCCCSCNAAASLDEQLLVVVTVGAQPQRPPVAKQFSLSWRQAASSTPYTQHEHNHQAPTSFHYHLCPALQRVAAEIHCQLIVRMAHHHLAGIAGQRTRIPAGSSSTAPACCC